MSTWQALVVGGVISPFILGGFFVFIDWAETWRQRFKRYVNTSALEKRISELEAENATLREGGPYRASQPNSTDKSSSNG